MTAQVHKQHAARPTIDVGSILIFLYSFTLFNLSYQEGLQNFGKFAGVLIIIFLFAKILRREVAIKLPFEFILLFVWFIWALFSSLFANDVVVAFSKLMTLIQVMGLSLAICLLVIKQGTTAPFWAGVIFSALISGLLTLINPEAFVDFKTGRLNGPVGNANLFGVILIAAMTASASYAQAMRSLMSKVLLALLTLFFFYMLVETGSRKAMVGSLVAMSVVFLIVSQRLRKENVVKYLLMSLFGLLVLAGGFVYLQSSTYSERFGEMIEAVETGGVNSRDRSIKLRIKYFRLALEATSDNPVTGIGLNNYRYLEKNSFGQTVGTYSHNNYTEMMVSTGLPGFFLYFIIYVSLLVRIYSLRSAAYVDELVGPFAVASTLAVITIIFDFAMVSYTEKVSWLLLAGVIAQLELQVRNSRARTLRPENH